MKLSLRNDAPQSIETACLVIGVVEDAPLSGPAQAVDAASNGLISALIKSGDIDPDKYHTTLLHKVDGVAAERILVVGCGMPERFDSNRYFNVCKAAGAYLREHAVTEAHVTLNQVDVEGHDAEWRLRQAVIGFDHSNYLYSATKPIKDHSPKPVTTASFQGEQDLSTALAVGEGLCAGYRRARELGNLPPNICNPVYLAEQGTEIAEKYENCSIEILDREEMEQLGMGALLAVAQGSRAEPRLVVLKYNGGPEGERPYVFVGKGVTFDTGGISLKPAASMEEMKFDMCGAAGVIGAFEACAHIGIKVNLITVVAAVENMPDGNAYRPGDVVTSMSGKTIEILNTDAEGRLALCDALTYSERFDPAAIIDVATLTGACVVALGHHATAVMTKHDDLSAELISAGNNAVDRAWPLPLWEDYQPQLKSMFADMKNVGGLPAGAITAGLFLSKYTRKMRWAHLDIAGSAWKWNGKEGATGRPVGLLTQFLIDRES